MRAVAAFALIVALIIQAEACFAASCGCAVIVVYDNRSQEVSSTLLLENTPLECITVNQMTEGYDVYECKCELIEDPLWLCCFHHEVISGSGPPWWAPAEEGCTWAEGTTYPPTEEDCELFTIHRTGCR